MEREGKRLVIKRVVVHACAEGETCARNLRDPPEAVEHGAVAGQHAAAEVVHDGGADLGGGIESVGVREGTEKGIALCAVILGDGAAGGPSVKSSGAVADGDKGVPEFLLAGRGSGAFDGLLDRRVREGPRRGDRFDGRRFEFGCRGVGKIAADGGILGSFQGGFGSGREIVQGGLREIGFGNPEQKQRCRQ